MQMRLRAHAFLLAAALALGGCATGTSTPTASLRPATPAEAGLAAQPLQEFTASLQAQVDAGTIPGAVLLVARDGRIATHTAVGWRNREDKVPMTTDSLFRIASMTKPVTAVAAMILVDEGKLKLSDPVAKYIPEFGRPMQVGVERPDAAGKPQLQLEPAAATITVLDLLRHTSGITYGVFGRSLVKDRYNAINLFDVDQTNADFARKLATLPLQVQPGTRFEYGMSFDLLGRVVEAASGMEFGQFVTTRILQPLAMNDTSFWVGPDKLARLAEPLADPATGKRMPMVLVTRRITWAAGGHGLVSTAQDYARFCQMLLNGGTLDGVRILSTEAVAEMRRDHLPAQYRAPSAQAGNILQPSVDNGNGFGLSMAVRTSAGTNNLPGSVGDFSWAGAYGTFFWIDPKERLVTVLMLQAPQPVHAPWRLKTRQAVYRALQ